MKRTLAKTLALTVVLVSVFWMVSFQVGAASNTLIVPDQYTTISQAINHASEGDTILIKSGTYQENIVIDKPLTIVGQKNPVIVGTGGPTPAAALSLAADNINVSGLTIQSVPNENTTRYAYGIWVEGDNCTIQNNIVQATYIGIFNSIQSFTTVTGNTITASIKDGMRFLGGSHNTISNNDFLANTVSAIALNGYSNTVTNNNFQYNTRSIGLGASNSVVFGNIMQFNSESAIWLGGSENIVCANNFENGKYGIYVSFQSSAPTANTIYHNNFENNTYNVYTGSSALVQIWDNGIEAGGNYWSDYLSLYPNAVQVDQTGIGNTPYAVNVGNKDNYPLLKPFYTDLSNPPTAIAPGSPKPNSVIASWSFNNVGENLVTPDAEGNNPAVLGSETAVYNYTPAEVPGKFGQALDFTGNVYAAVRPLPSIVTTNEITIDAWIKLNETKEGVAYNNIFIEAQRTMAALPTRTLGLAVNGETPSNTSSPPIGALRGYITTAAGLNEIDAVKALPSNVWVHVVFTRSASTGMHLYVDGQEQNVMVFAGTANPIGDTIKPTDIYIGHDATVAIDELKISNTAVTKGQPLWLQWWLWVAVIFAAALGSGLMLFNKKLRKIKG